MKREVREKEAIDHKALHDNFSTFGSMLSCKVVVDGFGQSKCYRFFQFDSEEVAQKAIEKLNGMLFNDKKFYVVPFLRRQERDYSSQGKIQQCFLCRDVDGKSKCFVFVKFESTEDVARLLRLLMERKLMKRNGVFGKAQKKSEREHELKQKFEQSMKEAADKYQGAHLYVKILDDNIVVDKLKEMFSSYGIITSCKVMRDPNGISRGPGFVAFSTPEEASRAIQKRLPLIMFIDFSFGSIGRLMALLNPCLQKHVDTGMGFERLTYILREASIAWEKHTRVILDVGCGVGSFGGYLFERDVIAMSLAPKEEHEAQVQFSFERGIPSIFAVMGSQRFFIWSSMVDEEYETLFLGGKLLLELNRVLRPSGYFAWSATPVYQKLEEDVEIWKVWNQTRNIVRNLLQ
ncbi:hypothetical protein RYX36_012531 [Vicia faba]